MAIIDDETLQMYIEESKEHLESIESDLLEIEQGGEAIDEELVNKVFRAAHSIKGGGGFLGLDGIKELSHKIENVLDLVRNYQLAPSPDVVNIVLKAFDCLGEMLDDSVNSNDRDIGEHLSSLKKIVEGSLDKEEQGSDDSIVESSAPESSALFSISQFDLNNAVHGGKNLYIIKYQHSPDMPETY